MPTDEEVQAYIKAQVDATVAHVLAQAIPPPSSRIKPVKPEALFGKPNENVRQWIFSVELWFTAGHVTSDIERVTLAVSLLRDAALVWWRSIHDLAEAPTA